MTQIMAGAEPFFFQGDSTGCLLVHGFTGTPNELRWLGRQLAADGRTVLGVRLAGHGTTPEEMNTTHWPDWYASALDGYEQLHRTCKQVFVGGLSMGGMLAALLAARRPVAGLILLATPAHIHDWRIWLYRPFQPWMPYVAQLPSDLQGPWPEAERPEYDRMPTACILSLLELTKTMRRELPSVRAPALLVSERQDGWAPPRNMQYFVDHLGTADKRMEILERGGHGVTVDLERETVLEKVRAFLARCTQKQ